MFKTETRGRRVFPARGRSYIYTSCKTATATAELFCIVVKGFYYLSSVDVLRTSIFLSLSICTTVSYSTDVICVVPVYWAIVAQLGSTIEVANRSISSTSTIGFPELCVSDLAPSSLCSKVFVKVEVNSVVGRVSVVSVLLLAQGIRPPPPSRRNVEFRDHRADNCRSSVI